MKEPVYISYRTIKDAPGSVGTSLEIRMYRKGELYSNVLDKWAGIKDIDNQASRSQLLDSILRMIDAANEDE
jgi:hypothetical protein